MARNLSAHDLFVLTTRGLESVSRDEIADIHGVTLQKTGYRRVVFSYDNADLTALMGIRTADDLFVAVDEWSEITRPRATLDLIEDLSTQLALESVIAPLRSVRAIPDEPVFSVTASFVGKRNYSSDEIKIAVANGVDTRYAWRYSPDVRESDLNIRLFIEHDVAVVGVRVGKNALHERAYKREQRPGSLKPPIAAGMLKMAGIQQGATVCDPFCGTGTLLIEAMKLGFNAIGGDIETDALTTTHLNAQHAGVSVPLSRWNARTLPFPGDSIDAMVTNLPWGRQVVVDDALAQFYASACQELARVVKPDGQVVILTSTPELLHFDTLQSHHMREISLYGQRPTIAIYG